MEQNHHQSDDLRLVSDLPPETRKGHLWGVVLTSLAVLGVCAWGFDVRSQQPAGLAALAVSQQKLRVEAAPAGDSREAGVTGVITDNGAASIPLDKVIGKWVLKDSIRRVIEIRPDGTATLHVTLDFFGSLLYGSELTMELSWSVDNGILSHTVISGKPKSNVERLIRDFGSSRHYRIVELNDDVLLLEGFDKSKTRYRWVSGG